MTYGAPPRVADVGMGSKERRYDLWPARIREMVDIAGPKGMTETEIGEHIGICTDDDQRELGAALVYLSTLDLISSRKGRWTSWKFKR